MGDVGPRHSPKLPHDGRIWRPHVPLHQRAGQGAFCEVSLEAVAGPALGRLGRSQKISGKDPDFHRRDLWEAIENGDFPEWEFGVQIVEEKDEHKFDFDLLDADQDHSRRLVPVRRIGKLTLNRNPDNFFAETEQVLFTLATLCPESISPTIRSCGPALLIHGYTVDSSGRPKLSRDSDQPPGRAGAQQSARRLYASNDQSGRVSYEPNTLGGGCPFQARADMGGFASYAERIDGQKVRARSASFFDHFSQATLFLTASLSRRKNHIVQALRFELGKVETRHQRAHGRNAGARGWNAGARVAQGLGIACRRSSISH